MPFLVYLPELRTLTRVQAAVQRIKFIDDTDLNPWIVNAWVRLYDIYVFGGDPYFETQKTVVVQSGFQSIPPPTDLYALRRVDYLVSDGRPVELSDLDVHQMAEAAMALPVGNGARALGYRFRAQEIQLPQAAAGQSYQVTYAPKPAEPRDATGTYLDTAAMDMVDIKGRDWVVLMAGVRCLQKQREDASGLANDAAILRREIELRAVKRTITRLKRVADTASQSFEDPYLNRRRWSPWVPWR